MLSIIKAPDPRLLVPCRLAFEADRYSIMRMYQILDDQNAAGLAANQVGLDAHFFITQWGQVFTGMYILEQYGEIEVVEGCLSLPGVLYNRVRAEKIVTNLGTFTGEKAIIIQHEIDHLEGREPWNERSIQTRST